MAPASLFFIHLNEKKQIPQIWLTLQKIAATSWLRGHNFELYQHQQPDPSAAYEQLYLLLLYVYPADDGVVATIRGVFIVGIKSR